MCVVAFRFWFRFWQPFNVFLFIPFLFLMRFFYYLFYIYFTLCLNIFTAKKNNYHTARTHTAQVGVALPPFCSRSLSFFLVVIRCLCNTRPTQLTVRISQFLFFFFDFCHFYSRCARARCAGQGRRRRRREVIAGKGEGNGEVEVEAGAEYFYFILRLV